MNKKSRKTIFVCCGIKDGNLSSKTIEASSADEASSKFEEEIGIKPSNCHGPFLIKKVTVKNEYTKIVFSGESKNVIYNDWYVKALFTIEPHNCAYLLFDKRVDGKKIPKPQGTIIVKNDYLKEIK